MPTAITGATYAKYELPPKVLNKTLANDSKDMLYRVTLPDAAQDDSGFAMVYSKTSLQNGTAVPATAIFLQNQDGSLFSVDAADDASVSLVAEGKNLSLYVYSPSASGAADRYTFNATTGIATAEDEQPASVDALGISAAEAKSLRDIDGDNAIGAKLEQTNDSTGGLYKVSVANQNIFTIGTALDKAKVLDVSKSALTNSDGSYWAPDNSDAQLQVVSKINKETKTTTYEVYATDVNTQEVTRYAFDKDRKLVDGEDGTTILTAAQMASAEKLAKRDLNNDSFVGVDITGTVDAKTGLFKGSLLGQEFYLAGTGLKDGTAAVPTDTAGTLVDASGEAWALDENSSIGAAILGTGEDADKLTLYVYEGGSDVGTHDQVLKYSFTKNADTGNYSLDEGFESGQEVDIAEFSAAEKLAKRDLNNDGYYGVSVQGAADSTGGLYSAKALGNDYLVVGRNVTSSAAKPFDLSTALLNADGTAWAADDVSAVGNDSLRIVTRYTDSKAVEGFDVYAKEDSGTYAKYSFGADYKLSDEGRVELTLDDLAAAEKTTARDLNMDGAFGAVVNRSIDSKGGLYKASFGDVDTIYLHETQIPAIGSKVAARAVDLTNALRTEDGSDYWTLDDPDHFTVNAGYTDADGNYNVIAQSNEDPTVFQRYTFTDGNNTGYADLTLTDLSAIEGGLKRDLNGDSVVGVKVLASADKVGGLQVGSAAGRSFLLIGANPKVVTDLSKALVNADGQAWATTADGSFDTNVYDASTDSLVLKQKDDGVYALFVARKDGDNTTVRQYEFDASYTLVDDDNTGKTLSDIELADAEKTTARDINADKSIGAKLVMPPIDKVGGLYKAQISGNDFYVVSDAVPDKKGMSLTDKVLLSDDGNSAWQASGTLTGIVAREGGGYWVYESDNANTITRHSFDADRVYQESEALTTVQVAHDEKAAGRDLSNDKIVGVQVDPAVDKTSGLYSAHLLGQNYFVVGSNLKTGKTSDTAVDLSKALVNVDGNAWAAEDGYSIAGGNLDAESGNYSVYTYKKENDEVTSVHRSTWNAQFEFQETVEADPVELIALETDKKRDFSGDGFVGFRVLSTKSVAAYAGVTEARVSNDTSFWLVGDAAKQGSKTNPLSLKNALLNEDGSGPWYLDSSYFVKSVDDSGSDREVYVTDNAGSQVLRFTFDKTNGRVKNGNEATEVNGVELAKREVELKRDLNGDSYKGAHFVEPRGQTGLLNVSILGQDYMVVGKQPAAGKSIDLSKALLNTDGQAWAQPDGVSVRGVFVNADGDTEVYGTSDDDGSSVRYTFSPTEGDTTLTLKTDAETLSGIAVALREASAGKDFNNDSSIGYKVGDQIASQANGWAVGHAGAGAADDDQIYIVGRNLSSMGSKSTNLANNAALVESLDADTGIPTYWKPDQGYTIKSIVQTADANGVSTGVSIYAKQDDQGSDHTDDYLRYDFAVAGDYWTLSAASDDSKGTAMDPMALAKEEVSLKRDLSDDGNYGLEIKETVKPVTNALTSLFKASMDGQDFLLIGSNLTSGTSMRPQGFSGLLLDSSDPAQAWAPGDGAAIAEFGKVKAPGVDDVPNDAAYYAKLDDDSTVYFKSGSDSTWVQIS